jgi:hypothetical protein
MRRWLQEGRVSRECLVWREGWADWKSAADVFAQQLGGSTAGNRAPESLPAAIFDDEPGVAIAVPSAEALPLRARKTRKKFRSSALALVISLGVVTVGLVVVLIWVLAGRS